MVNYTTILVLIYVLLPSMSYANFFEQRYRGWLWFEEKMIEQDMMSSEQPSNDITPEQAKEEIEQFAKELAELKFMMLARPTPANVKAYRDKEKQMWQQAEKLHDSWDMANLLYPQQRDLINNPVNVHGVKAKRAIQEAENSRKIQQLAKKFDLVLFFSEQCQYSQLLGPVLKNFGSRYGFNIDAVSSTGSKHEYFKTYKANGLIERLNITEFMLMLSKIKEGIILDGTVKNITDYGAFIALGNSGNVDGLLHVTDISWSRINHPSEVLSLDQKVRVIVIKFNEETKRISLGMKQLDHNPWQSPSKKISKNP